MLFGVDKLAISTYFCFFLSWVRTTWVKPHLDDVKTCMPVAQHCELLRDIHLIDSTNTAMSTCVFRIPVSVTTNLVLKLQNRLS